MKSLAWVGLFVLVGLNRAVSAEPPAGFRAIFNGKDLSGWYGWNPHDGEKLQGAEREANLKNQRESFSKHWSIVNGELVNGGTGPYATTDDEFGDIELLIEYKTVPKADSGIYLRGTPQVQIWDINQKSIPENPHRNPNKGSGGLFNNTPQSRGRDPLVVADRPFGEWNSFRIRQIGNRTWVWLNHKLVVDDAVMENHWDRSKSLPAKGPIILQTRGGEIRWRNIFVHQIDQTEAAKLIQEADANPKTPDPVTPDPKSPRPIAARDTEILVLLPKNLELPRAHVLIYRIPDKNSDWPPVQVDVARESETEVKTSLPNGQYIAEIGAVVGNELTLLRSSPFSVPKTTRVAMFAERITCGAVISREAAHIRQLALRRLGNGEVRWTAENSPPPTVVTSPGQPYVASCIADLGQKYMALWTRKEVIKASRLTFSENDAPLQLRFALREGTPALLHSHVTLLFPETYFTVHDPAQAVFITNRPRLHCHYQLETDAKEKLTFIGGACLIKNKATFEMGGSLKPRMFAGFIGSETGNGWDPGALRTHVNLTDAGGLIFDSNNSQPNFRTELFFAPGKQDPVPLQGHMPGSGGFTSDSVLARVHYTYGGRAITSECRGEGAVRVYSEHFSIATPPMWKFKARQFLSCLEAIRVLTINNTGRPGPASFHIDWRGNGDSAKSIVGSPEGGAHDIWMSFPWWTFDNFWDPFSEPWFGNGDPYVCHEILHAFGYDHGNEMSQLEWRAEDQYRSIRWRSAETGNWIVGQFPLRDEKNSQ
jgi:hypothetical protein